MELNIKLIYAVFNALTIAMKKRCLGYPIEYEKEICTIESSEEMLETIKRFITDNKI